MSTFVTIQYGVRQYKISCTPARSMKEVLNEVCGKLNLNTNSHGLRHGKINLDLSLSFRLTHLPNGARLELITIPEKEESDISVALNMLNCPRTITKILPSTTLWKMLERFESDHNLVLTNAAEIRDGKRFRQQPVVQLLNREYQTDRELQSTSLSSIGIKSGNVSIRLSHKSTDILLDSVVAVPVPSVATRLEDASIQSVPFVVETPETTTLPASQNLADALPLRPTREIKVLLAPSSGRLHSTSSPDLEIDEFVPSIEQARAYHKSLASRSQSSAPLLTQKLRDQQLMEKREKARPDRCRVKFRFGDGTQVISIFGPSETANDLYQFIRSTVTVPLAEFFLELLGTRKKIPSSHAQLWQDLDFPAAVAIQVVGTIQVSEEYRRLGRAVMLQEEDVPDQAAQEESLEYGTVHFNSRREDERQKTKKIPKWLQKTLEKK